MSFFKNLFGKSDNENTTKKIQEYEIHQVPMAQDNIDDSSGVKTLQINKVEWMDREAQSIHLGDLIITHDYKNNRHVVSFNGNNGGSHNIETSTKNIFSIEIHEQRLDDRSVFISQNEEIIDFFVMPEYKVKEIVNYYNQINESIDLMQKEFAKEVEIKTLELLNNQEIYNMAYNYIAKTNQAFFLNFQYFIALEKSLEKVQNIGRYTLDTQPLNVEISDEIDYESVKSYLTDVFMKFIHIINKKVELSIDEISFVTWNLLKKVAVKYYYDVFDNQYGVYFKNIENLTFVDCVKTYCNIDTIDANSASNASIFTYYLIKTDKFSGEFKDNFIISLMAVTDHLLKATEEKKLDLFEKSLMDTTESDEITIDDIDLMSGQEFEHFIAMLFRKMGYSSNVTKHSGDQGIDIIAEKNGKKLGIQAKCYSGSVSNSAIQEVVAGLKYYNLDKGIVVTNNFFTNSAVELAESNGIVLWDRNLLKEKISEAL